MATKETQKLDSIIASRRSVMLGGGALAALALTGSGVAKASIPAMPNDTDILNFALNLEYLEAQFYTLATEGVTADKAATGPITLPSGSGAVTVKANPRVQFASAAIGAYAFETALEERHHVTFLQNALKTGAVAQPAIDLQNSFAGLGTLIGAPGFDPFVNDLTFLYGAFIFEDVGVTAYHGGAAYLTKANLTPAVQIHAVEAYHAGLVRTSIYGLDQGVLTIPGINAAGAAQVANNIVKVRATLDGTYGKPVTAGDTIGLTGQDDFGLTSISVPLNGTAGQASTIVDAGQVDASGKITFNNYIVFARTLKQVLNIVYADATGANVPGGFFPKGLNGTIS